MSNRQNVNEELDKLKRLKKKYQQRLTIERLKVIKGFEHLTDEDAKQMIEQLEEFASIILKQINRNNQNLEI